MYLFEFGVSEGITGIIPSIFQLILQKSLPLNTPTWIPIGDTKLKVTLFDVGNHHYERLMCQGQPLPWCHNVYYYLGLPNLTGFYWNERGSLYCTPVISEVRAQV